jgi:hypothetical protein
MPDPVAEGPRTVLLDRPLHLVEVAAPAREFQIGAPRRSDRQVPERQIAGNTSGLLLLRQHCGVGFNRSVARRLSERHQLEAGLRVVEGEVAGLTNKWRHGRATVERGRLDFVLYWPLGIRLPRLWTSPVVLLVDRIEEGECRPTTAEVWSLNAATDVIRLRVANDAVVEWAVQRFQSEWAAAQVAP